MKKHDPYMPKSGKEWQEEQERRDAQLQNTDSGSTDFNSLMNAPLVMEEEIGSTAHAPKSKAAIETDFASLRKGYVPEKFRVPRTLTDWLIEFLTPLLIFVMLYAVLFFVLDVRYVYTAVHDWNLRLVCFCFLMGIVGISRMVARDGAEESILYIMIFTMTIGLYTLVTAYYMEGATFVKNFYGGNVWMAAGVNMLIVGLLWWVVNRLIHECCVDENRVAGDVGIMTGTMAQLQARMQRGKPAPRPKKEKAKPRDDAMFPMMELEDFDPTVGYIPQEKEASDGLQSFAARMPKLHPGISIFMFSVPVLAIFALGLRATRHGGADWVFMGSIYMTLYTFCALMLLMLTSLGGLREYFRARNVPMPRGIGIFWIGLGLVMLLLVMIAAKTIPQPDLPPLAYVAEHENDVWNRGDKFKLAPMAAMQVDAVRNSTALERMSQGAMGILIVFSVYAALKILGLAAWQILKEASYYPRWVVWLFRKIEWFVSRITTLPKTRLGPGRIRIQKEIATSMEYNNSLGEDGLSVQMSTNDHVEYAYHALCALAHDIGVPREPGQTPTEFIHSFPKALAPIQDQAEELTQLYIVAAYSPLEMDDRIKDRLRKFWLAYNKTRRSYIR